MLDDEGGLLHGGPLTAVDTWERGGEGRGERIGYVCGGDQVEGRSEGKRRAINHMRRPDVPTYIITFIQVLQFWW